jgi:hypothetical protein
MLKEAEGTGPQTVETEERKVKEEGGAKEGMGTKEVKTVAEIRA